MSGRPEILFPLFAGLETLPGIGAKTARLFEKMAITRPRDLIYTLPSGGVDRRRRDSVQGAAPGEVVTVEARVLRHTPPTVRGRPYRITVEDAQTAFTLVWFRPSEDYLRRLLPVDETRLISGKVEFFDGHAQIVHPDHVVAPARAAEIPEFEPLYPLTEGLSGRQMARAAGAALDRAPDLPDWIDPPLLAREGWPGWRAAMVAAHHPTALRDVSAQAAARVRLAYDEFFAHQTTLALARARSRRRRGRSLAGTGKVRDRVMAASGFDLTGAQARVLAEIGADMASAFRMNRLLQGDVGSGKTLVALLALVQAVEAGAQGVLMAPTEILARQHAEGLTPLAEAAGLRLACLTGRDSGAARRAILADLASGKIDILVGTHAVFQGDVLYHDLGLAVIDEQHRFGVRQRLALGDKGRQADVLVMTATPIPRSLAMTQYGDMDLSVLDEKPPGRKPVQTALLSAERLDEVVAHLTDAIGQGRQAYWVCPLVEESEVVALVAAESRFRALRVALGEGRVGLVHGQMAGEDKDRVMADFVAGRLSVLVATTVIEVGVNVPAASIMVIEQAESFGLSQLHQLRGRVGRGEAQSTCLLVYGSNLTETARRRLTLLRETEDGFRIAEEDLVLRGAGDVLGVAQSGLPRFRIADLETQAGLMATARRDAEALLASDPDLTGLRGQAVRTLLWLLEQDRALKLLDA
ncbi:MAG: ATP-dependent DNA helicase RecG [Qingshengfaniella sp.]